MWIERSKKWDTIRRGGDILHIVSPTDCVRDRLAKFYFWNDLSAFEAAKGVYKKQNTRVDLDKVRAWSMKEGEREKFEQFYKELRR